jgi:DNA-directed RNA polymerase alpha subunit
MLTLSAHLPVSSMQPSCVVGGENAERQQEERKLVMIDPSPELPDDMPVASVELPPKVRQALIAAGLRTIGKIRETSDTEILRIQHLGQSSLNFLRDTLGLPSSMGVRRDAIPITAKPENRDD